LTERSFMHHFILSSFHATSCFVRLGCLSLLMPSFQFDERARGKCWMLRRSPLRSWSFRHQGRSAWRQFPAPFLEGIEHVFDLFLSLINSIRCEGSSAFVSSIYSRKWCCRRCRSPCRAISDPWNTRAAICTLETGSRARGKFPHALVRKPYSVTHFLQNLTVLFTRSSVFAGIRIVFDLSLMALDIACLIHQVAYVLNLYPFGNWNFPPLLSGPYCPPGSGRWFPFREVCIF